MDSILKDNILPSKKLEEIITIQTKKNGEKDYIYCPFTRFGCTKLVEGSKLNDHTAACEFRPLKCKHCNKFISISQLEVNRHYNQCIKCNDAEELNRSQLIISKIADIRSNSAMNTSELESSVLKPSEHPSFVEKSQILCSGTNENINANDKTYLKIPDLQSTNPAIAAEFSGNDNGNGVIVENSTLIRDERKELLNCPNKYCTFTSPNPLVIDIHRATCKFLIEPCAYKVFGCNKEFPKGFISIHESVCIFKPKCCQICGSLFMEDEPHNCLNY